MNRRLQLSTLALSATTTVLAMLLLAGGPTISPPAPSVPLAATATTRTNAATADAIQVNAIRVKQSRQVRRSRALLALPYFSFAQGLRRVTGG